MPAVTEGSFPRTLQDCVLQKLSDSPEDVYDDSHLRLSLSNQGSIVDETLGSQAHHLSGSLESVPHCEILAFIDGLGCPRYHEKEVLQISMFGKMNYYLSSVNGRVLWEIKLIQSSISSHWLQNVQFLRGLTGAPGFVNLFGIVVDPSVRYLRGVLIELPSMKWRHLGKLVMQSRDQQIPWETREHWGRQIVEAVYHAHTRGFTIGTLWYHRPCILIDDENQLYFYRFSSVFENNSSELLYYPPEVRYHQVVYESTSPADCPKRTFKTDIFYLGMILWYLVEGFPEKAYSTPLCIREGCDKDTANVCTVNSHKCPVSLPPLNNVPQYYRNIVDSCRALRPNDRPAAQRILGQFQSAANHHERSAHESPQPGKMDPGSIMKSIVSVIGCDICGAHVKVSCFFCLICARGNFAVCLKCYSRGSHCPKEDHFLTEIKEKAADWWINVSRYHSSARDSGDREIIEL